MNKTNKESIEGIKCEKYDSSILDLKERVEKGDKLLQLTGDEDLTEEMEDRYHHAIILKPFYQRDYRFSIQDESSLIESIILGIPIPPIFLATTTVRSLDVCNVVDGQHRLRAVYRFMTNQFKLKDLPILDDINGKKYEDLHKEYKKKIKDFTITTYVFNRTPGLHFELELFNRYNKGTKPLTQQEIRNAVYSSPFSDYINGFVVDLNKDKNKYLKQAYNLTNDRTLKKKVHENMMTILYILEHGIDVSFKDSTRYANAYMEEKAELYQQDPEQASIALDEAKERFQKFNSWIEELASQSPNGCRFPFSKEIYNISNKQIRFQTSIAMILSGIYNLIISSDREIDVKRTYMVIQDLLSNSFLEDPNYRASTTNSPEISKLLNSFSLTSCYPGS